MTPNKSPQPLRGSGAEEYNRFSTKERIMRIIIKAVVVIGIFIVSGTASAHDITRQSDGPFSFSISGITINEGSSLERESILFNDPNSPVQIRSHSMEITYQDRNFRFGANSNIEASQPILGMQLRTIQYDAFGQHMQNLSNTEIKDFPPGEMSVNAQWRAREAHITSFLTAVTYVARVRLEDGSQWVFDEGELFDALRSLDLEQKIGEEQDDS